MPSRVFFLLMALGWLAPQLAAGQRFLKVETNLDSAVVVVDEQRVGIVGAWHQVTPSAGTMRLLPPANLRQHVDALSGRIVFEKDSLQLRLDFAPHHRVESTPYGAAVRPSGCSEQECVLGRTPLVWRASSDGPVRLEVTKAGFETETIELGSDVWNVYRIDLDPLPGVRAGAEVETSPQSGRAVWIDVAVTTLTLAATALSIHYKFKADDLYSEYEATGDLGVQDEVRAYDRRAAVALGVSQVGLGVLAFRLVFR